MIFILEGVDCCGKSSTAPLLATRIDEIFGTKTVVVNSSGATDIGKLLRGTVMHPDCKSLTPAVLRILFLEDFRNTLNTVIFPLVQSGHHVIVDRGLVSNLIYGAAAKYPTTDLSEQLAEEITSLLSSCVQITELYFKVPASTALERLKLKKEGLDVRDTIAIDSMSTLVEMYDGLYGTEEKTLSRADGEFFLRILDATKTPEEVLQEAVEKVTAVLQRDRGTLCN